MRRTWLSTGSLPVRAKVPDARKLAQLSPGDAALKRFVTQLHRAAFTTDFAAGVLSVLCVYARSSPNCALSSAAGCSRRRRYSQ